MSDNNPVKLVFASDPEFTRRPGVQRVRWADQVQNNLANVRSGRGWLTADMNRVLWDNYAAQGMLEEFQTTHKIFFTSGKTPRSKETSTVLFSVEVLKETFKEILAEFLYDFVMEFLTSFLKYNFWNSQKIGNSG